MYSIEEIKDLIATLDNSSLTNLEITCGNGEKLCLKKKVANDNSSAVNVTVPVGAATMSAPIPPMPPMGNVPSTDMPAPKTADAVAPAESLQGKTIDCPMVGVFYTSPSPDAEPYVKVGSKVNQGDVLCIIEAMKLMNEVTATESGTIKKVLVENGDIVEFGQPLFVIE